LEQSRKRYTAAHLRIFRFDFRTRISRLHRQLESHAAELGKRFERLSRLKRERLEKLLVQLEERSPLKVLERGYSIVTDTSGTVLRDATQVAVGDSVSIQLLKGKLTTEVKKKEV
jgi:exodeoxyribonuclease VII large subunit